MANLKVVLVGGGSYGWGPKVLEGLLLNPYLDGCQVVLHDIDSTALQLNLELAEKLRELAGRRTKFVATTVPAVALEGADFVVVTISTGGLEAMRVDLEVPEKYGVFHTVGDTVGPGGLLRLLRNVPVFLQLARTMEKQCPSAWMINCSNPLSGLTRVVNKETAIRAVGMCHGVRGVAAQLARFFDCGLEECAYLNTGIDHCAWFTQMLVQGRCVWDLLRAKGLDEWLQQVPSAAREDAVFKDLYGLRCGLALGRQLGALPAIGDRHMVEFFADFLLRLERLEHYGLKRTTIGERHSARARARERLERLLNGAEELQLAEASGRPSDDVAGWIAALAGGPVIEDNLNVPNLGQIPQLPAAAVVETRGVLDATGFRPLVSPMPAAIEAIVRPHVLRQELSVEAAVEGNFERALEALLSDPLLGRIDSARSLLEEMMAGTREWLPQFK